ncbi:hypothetical protein A33K_17338 [Burkholderia humptydooensis MSMB43]|uniref:Uncharacterized protein n=1 Tax=Burkholderia humptydooensis MSMB43 TaxID=441157 RepID=A0ABN0G265_9BURK|nr:hypothetical protein A33K_17338 [Burkholderia humptydooensis MSMB43]
MSPYKSRHYVLSCPRMRARPARDALRQPTARNLRTLADKPRIHARRIEEARGP